MHSDVRSALARIVCMTALVIATASTAFAQTEEQTDTPPEEQTEQIEEAVAPPIIFTNITDAAPGVCYDANPEKTTQELTVIQDDASLVDDAASAPALLATLKIGVHSGTNPATWMNTACIASTAAFHVKQMSDTIALRVNAPEGYYVETITLSQNGSTTAYRLAQSFAGAQWVVDGHAAMASIDGASANLTGLCKTSVPVSFSIFLGAKVVSTPGSASASVSNPILTAKLAPLPDSCR